MKSIRPTLSFLFAAGVTLASSGMVRAAGPALPEAGWDWNKAGMPPALESLGAGFKALGARTAAESARRKASREQGDPQDALSQVPACRIVDAKTFVPYTLEGALKALRPCLGGLAGRYGASVRAQQGMVGIDQGRNSAVGIQLRVAAEAPAGGRAVEELDRSVRDLRAGRLMGFPAAVLADAPGSRGAGPASYEVPAWIDGPSLRIEEGQTRLEASGDLRVVLFDKNDSEVEFLVLAGGQATVSFIMADDREAGPYALDSLQALQREPLHRMFSGVTVPEGLDARTRAAVTALLARL